MPRIGPMLPLLGLLSLGGCGDTFWGGETGAAADGAAATADAPSVQVPVQAVQSVEIGRTRDGFLLTAYGTAAGLGYAQPRLRPRRDGAPGVDGYLEYDFVATEPPAGFNMPAGSSQARRLRADLPIPGAVLRGARGIRILGLTGGAQLDFEPPAAGTGQS